MPDEYHVSIAVNADDKEFTLEEFGTMLTTFSKWGMRIVFVPEDEPDIVSREQEK